MIRDGLAKRGIGGAAGGAGRAGGNAPGGGAGPPESFGGEQRTDLEPGDDPAAATGGMVVGDPQRGVLGRLDARTRSILTGAAIAAVLVNAGAVWAYWVITGSETGRTHAGTVVEMNLRGRSNLNKPLTPGSTGDLTVTVTNDNDFPIRITSVSPGTGNVVADDEHRENGCVDPGVVVRSASVEVLWEVARNDVGAFIVPHGLAMATTSAPACAGAIFTVPVRVNGVAGVN